MIGFMNFIIMLAWSFLKLLFILMMGCIVIIVLKPLSKEVAEIFSDLWKKITWTWEEVKAMENEEWGDTQ